jgi:hypothetical protein
MADSFDSFSVLFGKGEVFINGKTYPLGQCTTDILDLDDDVLEELDRHIEKLMPAVQSLLQEKTDSAARSAQEQLSAVWDLIFSFPVYRDLNMDAWTANNLFLMLLSDPEKWAEVQDAASEGHAMFQKLLEGLEYFPESLRTFRGQVSGIPCHPRSFHSVSCRERQSSEAGRAGHYLRRSQTTASIKSNACLGSSAERCNNGSYQIQRRLRPAAETADRKTVCCSHWFA